MKEHRINMWSSRMRYFVTILTLYINSSRAYMPTHTRSTWYVEERLRTLRKLRKRGIEENGGRKRKEKRAQRDLLLMKNKYTTHADEPLPSSSFINFSSPLPVLQTLSFLFINFIQCTYIYICICVYMHVYTYTYICIAVYKQFIGTLYIFVRIFGFASTISACKCANY